MQPNLSVMIATALQDLFGGKAAEAVLLSLFHQGETYGRAVARDFGVSLDGVQKQLDRFERSGVIVCKRQGRTLVYSWNPKSRLTSRLKDLIGVIFDRAWHKVGKRRLEVLPIHGYDGGCLLFFLTQPLLKELDGDIA